MSEMAAVEPPVHTVIEICDRTRWYRSVDGWFCITEGSESDYESWTKLAGNYGPVTIIRTARGRWTPMTTEPTMADLLAEIPHKGDVTTFAGFRVENMGRWCDECGVSPHVGGYQRCECDCHPAFPELGGDDVTTRGSE